MPKKKKLSPRGEVGAADHASPGELKKDLQRLDRDIVRLANKRAQIVQRLAAKEQAGSAGTSDPDPNYLDTVVGCNQGPLEDHAIRSIFRELTSGTRALLRRTQVAYLGPPYSFSHLAAVEQFGTSCELIAVSTIAAVFESLDRCQADFGLVPIENSTDGRVADTLDMFARLPVRICGEVQLRIHHHLLGKCSRSEVSEVFSKPQALSQCRTWLAKNLPDAATVEMPSTAQAAKRAAEKPRAAAIASRQAGVLYGLNVIAADIEDNPYNVTRFAVIGNHPPRRTAHDKTSLMFEIPHQSGALADVMAIFKRNDLNLTWIESFPMTDTPNEYVFFVEFLGHSEDEGFQKAIRALNKKTVRLEVLGSYPLAKPIE